MAHSNSIPMDVNTTRGQIGVFALMATGAHNFRANDENLFFNVRVLAYKKDGTRGSSVRIMTVRITLEASDTYDVSVTYLTGRGATLSEKTHFEAEGVYADQLSKVIYALDSDGPKSQEWGAV